MPRTKKQYESMIARQIHRFGIKVESVDNRYSASINGKQFAMDLSSKELYQALELMWLYHALSGNLCDHCGRFSTSLEMAAMSLTKVQYYCPSCKGSKHV
jgi:hypothetical protein